AAVGRMTGAALWSGPGVALLAWAAHFGIMYALATFACGDRTLGLLATAACASVPVAVLLRARPASAPPPHDPETDELGRDAAAMIALLTLVAILWHAFAVLSLPVCVS
ncbi:MAG TPA: hypothetical protein VLK35_02735, partial [Methylomirabilota bacterium]|nr:hypothetical protein [Methylomirabilota bacterium]